MKYREATKSDILGMAKLRSLEWGTEEYWIFRITGYMDCKLHPSEALLPRVIHVAVEGDVILGFIAGHLTRRFECDGELQWINVSPEHRGKGIASKLLQLLAAWFIEQGSVRVCIDVDPDNTIAQRFYRGHGADNLNKHWLFWEDIRVVLKKEEW